MSSNCFIINRPHALSHQEILLQKQDKIRNQQKTNTRIKTTRTYESSYPSSSSYSSSITQSIDAGLSRFHRRLLTSERQRFRLGREYPLYISIEESPTRKWLGMGRKDNKATSQIYLNGTILERSVASITERCEEKSMGWYEEEDFEEETSFHMELVAEIHVRRPGYLRILPATSTDTGKGGTLGHLFRPPLARRKNDEMLWITDFSLTKRFGGITSLHIPTSRMQQRIGENHNQNVFFRDKNGDERRKVLSFAWPNEVNSVPSSTGENEDALLVTDGFLVPGRENGGLYVIRHPGHESLEWKVCLADGDGQWFYHRAIWVDLTGDGRQSILTARAKRPSILRQPKTTSSTEVHTMTSSTNGQLVWLERPKPFKYDEETGTPLDRDGTVFDAFSARHTPWKVRVLDEGPDVMFSVADLDPTDDTIEVIASQFFGKCLSLHSIKICPDPKISFRRVIDWKCGPLFSCILADLEGGGGGTVVDSGSTVPTLKYGDVFSHVLVTSHECTYDAKEDSAGRVPNGGSPSAASKLKWNGSATEDDLDGGSLFAYRIPTHWKTDVWTRSIIATGFRVKGQLSNMINPGAPGFCYTFYPTMEGTDPERRKRTRPYIAVSGDCSEAAYIFRPSSSTSTQYKLMCEIDCGGTVGSLSIGYDNLYDVQGQQKKYAKIYIPSFEKDKIFVFALGDEGVYEEEVEVEEVADCRV